MEGKFPAIKAIDIERALRRLGFYHHHTKGSHFYFKRPDGRFTSVPHHGGDDIGKGLLSKILNEAGISKEEFLDAL